MTSPAILAGDALLTLAMDVLARSGLSAAEQGVRLLSAAVQELVDGQIADLAFERRDDVVMAECLRMAAAKTGALLGAACALGAVFGGGTAEQVGALHRFGADVGLAFQLVDDLLGIWGDPAATGKPVCSDLRSRKKSLPVVVALTSGTAAGRELAALYRSDHQPTEAELAGAATLVEAAGGRAWCQDRADVLLAEAIGALPATTADHAAADLRGRRARRVPHPLTAGGPAMTAPTSPARTVLLASPRSFCAGVERAIEAVEELLDVGDGPVYVRRQIVHNTHVVADLEARGAVFVDELDAVPEGATVVFSAHGVAPRVWREAARRGLDVVDATCPLVAKVTWRSLARGGRGRRPFAGRCRGIPGLRRAATGHGGPSGVTTGAANRR